MGNCHGFPSAEIAAHAHEREEGESRALDQRQHVDAVADPARLHQQNRTRAAEIGAGAERHALLLGRERDRMHRRIGERTVDQDGVAGVRHIAELRDVVRPQEIVELVLPGGLGAAAVGVDFRVHGVSCSFDAFSFTTFASGASSLVGGAKRSVPTAFIDAGEGAGTARRSPCPTCP
jgi:hypothetical protein